MKEKQDVSMVEILPHCEMAVTTLHWLIEAMLGSFGAHSSSGCRKAVSQNGELDSGSS